jgi:thioredoxin 1
MTTITELGTADFDEVVKASERPVLVDFWAEWCGPCRPLATTLTALAQESDAMRIAKVNIDDHPDLVRRYAVMSAPTLIVFVEGRETKRLVGARPLATLRRDLSEFLS